MYFRVIACVYPIFQKLELSEQNGFQIQIVGTSKNLEKSKAPFHATKFNNLSYHADTLLVQNSQS